MKQDIFSCLEKIFTRLEQHGFSLKQEKCKFLLPVVEYLGYQISVVTDTTAPEQEGHNASKHSTVKIFPGPY